MGLKGPSSDELKNHQLALCGPFNTPPITTPIKKTKNRPLEQGVGGWILLFSEHHLLSGQV